MIELYPYCTNDGSIGLYNPSVEDIYHSAYGARTEAYEKFILPAGIIDDLETENEISVLDLCYGIGYNTKSFINLIFQLKNSKNKKLSNNILSVCNSQIYTDKSKSYNYNSTIHSDNKSVNNFYYNDEIYSDNNDNYIRAQDISTLVNNKKFFIKAIDTDKNLAALSPFILSKTNMKNFKNLNFNNEKISDILNKKNTKNNHNNYNKFIKKLINSAYPDIISIMLFEAIICKYPEYLADINILETIFDKRYENCFNKNITKFYEFYLNNRGITNPLMPKTSFLHNIYYKYISLRYKRAIKCLRRLNIKFDLNINDARAELLSDNNYYNYIFLDAFTPTKCPCLWTYDFILLLKNHLKPNGKILTYSTSAAIRNAFLQSGLFIGNIINHNTGAIIGTIASKNKSDIKYNLSEFDLGLLKTKSGILYRDENLNALNCEILKRYNSERETSKLISVSAYKKHYTENLQFCNNNNNIV